MRVLLHICCALCASSCIEQLRQEGYQVSGFFYNPNIQPPAEYLHRRKQVEELARQENFPLIVGDYDADNWFLQVKGKEKEPEGGKRCRACFQLRLKVSAKIAKEKGFSLFTTTLTVSPHKDARLINEIGENLGSGLFLVRDFKKQDGFKRAQELARQYHLYHQDYCGCIFSLNQRQKDERLHQGTCPVRDKS